MMGWRIRRGGATPPLVTPEQAGVQGIEKQLDSRFRGNDEWSDRRRLAPMVDNDIACNITSDIYDGRATGQWE